MKHLQCMNNYVSHICTKYGWFALEIGFLAAFRKLNRKKKCRQKVVWPTFNEIQLTEQHLFVVLELGGSKSIIRIQRRVSHSGSYHMDANQQQIQ